MKKIVLIMAVSMFLSLASYAQVGIGTDSPDSSSILDLVSNSKGFLAPRMDSAHRKAITGAADGLMVYDSSYHSYFFWKNGSWNLLLGSTTGWALTGNSSIDTGINFLGTRDSLPLIIKTRNVERMRITPTGHVGIGKIPAVPFDLLGKSNFTGDASFQGNLSVSQSFSYLPGPITQFYNGLTISPWDPYSPDVTLSKEELSFSGGAIPSYMGHPVVQHLKFYNNIDVFQGADVLKISATSSAYTGTTTLINAALSNSYWTDNVIGLKISAANSGIINTTTLITAALSNSGESDSVIGLKIDGLSGGTITNAAGIVLPDVSGSARSVNLLLGTSTVPSGNFSIYNASSYATHFNGKVGMGTTSPTHPLHVSAASDPLRLEGLQSTSKDTVLVVSGTGVVSKRYSTFGSDKWALSGNGGTNPAANYLGTSDNNDLVIKANGSERIRVVSSGDVKIGNGANYTKIESDGTVEFNGTSTVWKDFVVPGTTGKTGTTPLNAPAFALFRNNGFGSSGVWEYMFQHQVGLEESLLFTLEMPHDWKENTPVDPHVHWSPMAAGAANVSWGIEYTWIDINGSFGNTVFATATTATAGLYNHQITSLGPINPNLGQGHISSILCVRLYRNIAQDTFNNNVALLSLDIHYEANTVGSRTEFTK